MFTENTFSCYIIPRLDQRTYILGLRSIVQTQTLIISSCKKETFVCLSSFVRRLCFVSPKNSPSCLIQISLMIFVFKKKKNLCKQEMPFLCWVTSCSSFLSRVISSFIDKLQHMHDEWRFVVLSIKCSVSVKGFTVQCLGSLKRTLDLGHWFSKNLIRRYFSHLKTPWLE